MEKSCPRCGSTNTLSTGRPPPTKKKRGSSQARETVIWSTLAGRSRFLITTKRALITDSAEAGTSGERKIEKGIPLDNDTVVSIENRVWEVTMKVETVISYAPKLPPIDKDAPKEGQDAARQQAPKVTLRASMRGRPQKNYVYRRKLHGDLVFRRRRGDNESLAFQGLPYQERDAMAVPEEYYQKHKESLVFPGFSYEQIQNEEGDRKAYAQAVQAQSLGEAPTFPNYRAPTIEDELGRAYIAAVQILYHKPPGLRDRISEKMYKPRTDFVMSGFVPTASAQPRTSTSGDDAKGQGPDTADPTGSADREGEPGEGTS